MPQAEDYEMATSNQQSAAETVTRPVPRRLRLPAIEPQLLGLLIALVILLVAGALLAPGQFFKPVNLISIGEGITLIGLTALAAAVVLILGGLDISIGSLVGFCSAAAGVAMVRADSPWAGIGAAVLVGVLGGALNGIIITKGKLEPVIVTLATYSAYRGLALLTTTNGYAVNVRNVWFNRISTTTFAGIPIPVFVLIGAVVAFVFLMGRTLAGRNIYAIGGNPNAARLAGINLNRYKLFVYTLSGLMAGLAGILLTARTKSGQPISGSEGLEMQAITAAILGGVSNRGGKGTIIGAFLGVLVIGVLNNIMILLSVPTFYQRVARGLLLIIAALIMNWSLFAPKKSVAKT
jgi:ribose transport system permease protein/L-arabinose transport system permease protein